MKNIFFLCLLCGLTALGITSCGNRAAQNSSAARSGVEVPLEIDALLAAADSLNGQTVWIEGVCTHTCKHGARKIFLMGSDDTKTLRVESGELGHFDPQCVNRVVRVRGRLCEERIDEACLARWEAQAAAHTAETHGETEAGCDTEKKARGEQAATVGERIADFRRRIAGRKAACGKEYLSFYYVEAVSYEME